jgi:site-specific recombinase XerD
MKLDALIDQTLSIIKERGYTEKTWKNAFRNGKFNSLRQYYNDRGTDEFNADITQEYIAAIRNRYKFGELSYSRCAHLVKLAAWIIEVHETGSLQWQAGIKSNIILNEYFDSALHKYLESEKSSRSKGSLANRKSAILLFLDYLQNAKGHNDFSRLACHDVHGFIEFTSPRYKNGLDYAVYAVKCFLTFLKEHNIISSDLSPSIQSPVRKRVRVLPCFTHDEADRILAQPDRNASVGKRNYAILILARDTGLRKGDIANLKLLDINWINHSLTIKQSKTSEPLTLPIEPNVENAIADYILNGRPNSNVRNVFLREYAPHTELSPKSIGSIFCRYLPGAGIEHEPHDGKSIHALRRSIASWMLDSGVSLEEVSQILGHRDMNSTKRYLPFDDANLKKCALTLCGIEVAKEGLI